MKVKRMFKTKFINTINKKESKILKMCKETKQRLIEIDVWDNTLSNNHAKIL